jgi:hypothetical protein
VVGMLSPIDYEQSLHTATKPHNPCLLFRGNLITATDVAFVAVALSSTRPLLRQRGMGTGDQKETENRGLSICSVVVQSRLAEGTHPKACSIPPRGVRLPYLRRWRRRVGGCPRSTASERPLSDSR